MILSFFFKKIISKKNKRLTEITFNQPFKHYHL